MRTRPASRALLLIALRWRREEWPLACGDVRPARTLVRAFAEGADRRPVTAFGLGQVLGADAIAAQVVVAPAQEIRSIAVSDVVAIGLDDLGRRRLPVVAGHGLVDLAQELRGVERMERASALVEEPGQRLVVLAEVRLDETPPLHRQEQCHVGMADRGQHELVGRHVHQEQAIEVDAVMRELEMRLVIARRAHGGVQPTQSLHLHAARHRVIRERPARAASPALR